MNFMRDKPNGFYDLAIVDPPYGGSGKENDSDKISMSRRGGTWATKYGMSMGGV